MKNQIDDYYVFCQVAKFGSMKKASEKIRLPLSTVSRRVVALEEGLGVQLFIRSKNKLTLSNEGERYYSALNSHLEAFRIALEELHEDSGTLHGNVVLSTTKIFYLRFLHPFLKNLLKENPDLSIELKNSHSAIDLTEDVDIAIANGELPESNLIARKLTEVPLIFVATQEFVKTYQSEINNGEFGKLPYVSTFSHPALAVLNKNTGERFKLLPDKKLVVMDLEMVVKATADSIGYAILPPYMYEEIDETHSLIEILPNYQLEPVTFSLLYRNKNLQSAAQRAVIDKIMEAFIK